MEVFFLTRTLTVALSLACLEISFFWSAAYAAFSLGIQNCVICHNVNTQNVKIARRDRPPILAFENLLLQLGQLFQGFYTQNIERSYLSV